MIIKLESTDFKTTFYIENFSKKAGVCTGTLLFHSGKVKLPGKIKPNMTKINLKVISCQPIEDFQALANLAFTNFDLFDLMIIHRIGQAFPGDNILLAGVSSAVKKDAFSALNWIIDEIKREKIISLIEE